MFGWDVALDVDAIAGPARGEGSVLPCVRDDGSRDDIVSSAATVRLMRQG